MRSDMQSVIIERPRVGGYKPSRPQLVIRDDLDEMGGPRKESMWAEIRRQGNNFKEQTDVIGPLRRYLHKQVGRPWNKIFSEIKEHANGRMGQHLLVHVDGEVERPVLTAGGLLNMYGWPYRPEGLWVNPRTGLLCLAPKWVRPWNQRQKKEQKLFSLGKQTFLFHKEIWYRVDLKKIEGDPEFVDDAFLGRMSFRQPKDKPTKQYSWLRDFSERRLRDMYGELAYCLRRECANGKEIKRLRETYKLAA